MPHLANQQRVPSILTDKHYAAASVFEPANLLREARRLKNVRCGCIVFGVSAEGLFVSGCQHDFGPGGKAAWRLRWAFSSTIQL